MIYQIDGKTVKHCPNKKEYLRAVVVGDKLTNYITKEKPVDNVDFFVNGQHVSVNRDLDVHINGKQALKSKTIEDDIQNPLTINETYKNKLIKLDRLEKIDYWIY